jgi:hypothetical protein
MAASQAAPGVRLGPECKIAVTAIPQAGTSVPAQTSKSREMERHCRCRGGHREPGRLWWRPRLSPDRARCVRAGGRPSTRLAGPLPGTITARTAMGKTFTATAGRDGRFTLSLPPGAYQATGRSPLMQSGQMICAATAELQVSRGQPARHVTVVCSIP